MIFPQGRLPWFSFGYPCGSNVLAFIVHVVWCGRAAMVPIWQQRHTEPDHEYERQGKSISLTAAAARPLAMTPQAAHLVGGDAVSLDVWARTRRLP